MILQQRKLDIKMILRLFKFSVFHSIQFYTSVDKVLETVLYFAKSRYFFWKSLHLKCMTMP